MKTAAFALLGLLILSSCATTGKVNGVYAGMTKAQVIRIVGNPDGYQRSGDYEALLYLERRDSWNLLGGSFLNTTAYSVILKDDHVIEFGPGRTHTRDAEMPFVRIPTRLPY